EVKEDAYLDSQASLNYEEGVCGKCVPGASPIFLASCWNCSYAMLVVALHIFSDSTCIAGLTLACTSASLMTLPSLSFHSANIPPDKCGSPGFRFRLWLEKSNM